MIKYILISVLGFSAIISGCTKPTEELFDETTDERLEKVLTAYKNALTQSPGWKLFVYPEGLQSENIDVGGLTYYLRFLDTNRVNMVSDFNVQMATVPKESGYRIKGMQRPSLIFDTYSYIHVAADPDETVSFSPAQAGGYGWGSDFDFSFVENEPGDTIILEGNFNNSDALLIRATQEEIDAAFAGEMGTIVQATTDYSTSNPFLYFPGSDNAKIGVSFNRFLFRVNFSFLSEGLVNTISAPYSHTTYGIHFKQPVTIGGYTFQDAYWDEAQQDYYINNGSSRIYITNSPDPLFPFNKILGRSVSSISVPLEPLPGQSPEFESVFSQVKANLANSRYGLELQLMDFTFDDESKQMALLVLVTQGDFGFILQYVYSYSFNSSNITNFSRISANANGNLVEEEMSPLLDYLDQDIFRLDYYTDNLPVLGEFRSQTNPSFFFTGNLQ